MERFIIYVSRLHFLFLLSVFRMHLDDVKEFGEVETVAASCDHK